MITLNNKDTTYYDKMNENKLNISYNRYFMKSK